MPRRYFFFHLYLRRFKLPVAAFPMAAPTRPCVVTSHAGVIVTLDAVGCRLVRAEILTVLGTTRGFPLDIRRLGHYFMDSGSYLNVASRSASPGSPLVTESSPSWPPRTLGGNEPLAWPRGAGAWAVAQARAAAPASRTAPLACGVGRGLRITDGGKVLTLH